MKKTYKSLLVIVVFVMIISVFENLSLATFDWKGKIDTAYNNSNKYDDSEVAKSTKTVVGTVVNAVRIVAAGVAMIMILVLAMKYMMASVGDRAEIKKHAVVYVVGAVVLFGSSAILTVIQKFSESI